MIKENLEQQKMIESLRAMIEEKDSQISQEQDMVPTRAPPRINHLKNVDKFYKYQSKD